MAVTILMVQLYMPVSFRFSQNNGKRLMHVFVFKLSSVFSHSVVAKFYMLSFMNGKLAVAGCFFWVIASS